MVFYVGQLLHTQLQNYWFHSQLVVYKPRRVALRKVDGRHGNGALLVCSTCALFFGSKGGHTCWGEGNPLEAVNTQFSHVVDATLVTAGTVTPSNEFVYFPNWVVVGDGVYTNI